MGNPIGFVYLIQIENTSTFKIGHSLNPATRLSDLRVASPYKLQLVQTWPGTPTLERYIHRQLAKYRLSGEWFDLSEMDAAQTVQEIIAHSGAGKYKRVRRQSAIKPRPLPIPLAHISEAEYQRNASGVSVYEKVKGKTTKEPGGRKYRGFINSRQLQLLRKQSATEQQEYIRQMIQAHKDKHEQPTNERETYG